MSVMRRALPAGAAAVLLLTGSGAASAGGDGPAVAPESDVAHHGHVSLSDGRLRISLTTRNHGPAHLEDVTVRLSLSAAPVGAPRLPSECLRAGERDVLCAMGPLSADGLGRSTRLDLRMAGLPQEVVVRVGTVWNGGASDRNTENNEHRVLAPATGDRYVF
ncbi:hypothetical protein [Streptomyces peucetius]|uniref:DUF11 domain-containing protein n=1 Tax=Streptomyces peucetius TaxID=1950 RepID=A0ABY6I9K8_STRPE|nr:hypothetical protein [Streptomyces peucetius]UYQ63678.1 hypothetical protein OGH68_20925 [Streptomyces peucetius]